MRKIAKFLSSEEYSAFQIILGVTGANCILDERYITALLVIVFGGFVGAWLKSISLD